jgi:RNA-directed DNA polymerase
MKIITSEREFAWAIGMPIARVRRIADTPSAHYHEFMRYKDASKTKGRMIRNPTDELKSVQRLIKDRVFGDCAFDSEVQGGVPGRSPKSNALKHVGARVLVTVDVKGFYDNVDHRIVFQTLRELGYGTAVARLITKLTTRRGLLPQGAPTSNVIANLVLARPVDAPTRLQAESTSTNFTRFVDDIGLSGDKPTALIGDVARRLSSRGLSIHRGEKLKIRPRSVPQTITGLNINSGRPTVPRPYRDSVRAAIYRLNGITDSLERAEAARKISGRIAYIRQFHPSAGQRLTDQLAGVLR